MAARTADAKSLPDTTYIVSLDVGTSSVRTLLFDHRAVQQTAFGKQLSYRVSTTPDGGVEIDAEELARLLGECLTALHTQMRSAGLRASAVAFCTFWHSFLGVDEQGQPTTPILHLLDTRSTSYVDKLAERLDRAESHARTGTVFHTSYWPARLLWLADQHPEAIARTRHWWSFGEFFYHRLFGRAAASTSMQSGTGIWNPNRNDYDEAMLEVLPIRREQLPDPATMDEPSTGLREEWRQQWPDFDGIPWFPALGDGACNNIGSGCVTPDRVSLMVGTTGAMRAVLEQPTVEIPPGLWCYRVDRRRLVLGGALSNGGEVFAWMRRTLQLPDDAALEAELSEMTPGAHQLTLLPLFAGERSTGWRADARAAIAGMSLHTRPVEIVRAALESVSLRFRQIYELISDRIGEPREVIASGAALLKSPAWAQMMADALGRPVVSCQEPEATSRGAALLALERIGAIGHIKDLPPVTDVAYEPRIEHFAEYTAMLARQRKLYRKLFQED